MADKKTEVCKEKTIISSGVSPRTHEDSNADNHDKKNVTTDIECGSTIDPGPPLQDKQNTVEETRGSIEEEFSLQLESSDEDVSKDVNDSGETSKSGIKSANSNKPEETLFSDIESSDDSIVYEPKAKEVKKQSVSPVDVMREEKKVIESEFEPVESDEEFFEDSLPDKLEPISQENILDKPIEKEDQKQEEEKDEEEEEETTSTTLIDEEKNKSTELNLNSEASPVLLTAESNVESIGSPPDVDLMLDSLVDTTDEIASVEEEPSNEEKTTNEMEITTSHHDSDKDEEVDDSPISPTLVLDLSDETVVPSSSLLIEANDKCPTSVPDSLEADKDNSESSKQEEDEKSCKEMKEDSETVEPSETLNKVPDGTESNPTSPTAILEDEPPEEVETEIEIPNEDIECSESSKKTQGEAHDPEKIEKSPENEDTDESVQGEQIETCVKTKNSADEKMEEYISSLEVSDIFASENENPDEEEESMQVDETSLEASGFSEMETNDDDVMAEKPESQAIENKILPTDAQKVADIDEELMQEATESTEIVLKLNEPEESLFKSAQPVEAATSQDLIEKEKENKSNKSPAPCESNEIQETKLDDRPENSPKASADEEIQDPTENQEDIVKISEKEAELLEKSDGVVESRKEVPVEHEKSSEKGLEDEKDKEATTEMPTLAIDATSTLNTTDKPNEEIAEFNKNSEETLQALETAQKKEVTLERILQEYIKQTKQQDSETDEPIMETEIDENDAIDENVSEEESNKQILQVDESSQAKEPAESEIGLTETLDSQKEYDEQASLQEAEKETFEVLEIVTEEDSIEKKDYSKKSEEAEAIKTSEIATSSIETVLEPVETPEVAAEVVVKVAEIGTSVESAKPNKITDSGTCKNVEKPSAKVYPEVIEIDDDDEIEEAKKIEDNTKVNEKINEKGSPSTSEKELQDKKTEGVAITPLNKEAKEPVTPMEVDREILTEKSAQKPLVKDQISNLVEESTTKDDYALVLDDEDEPLLMIDTSHKEDNDTESNLDNETATSAPTTDSSSEGSLEVFYDKECVNYECKRTSKNFYRATVFAMNYFKVSKKRTKTQFVCEDCYERSLGSYEELCKTLKMKQPLLHGTTFKCQEFVEIIDSSDEEESDSAADKVKVSDENTLPKESIEMLEAELEGAIRKVMHNVDIQKQLSWTKQILQQRLTNLQEDSDFVTEQLRALQRKADHMHNSLYQCPKIKLRQLTPLDLNSGRMYNPEADSSASIPLPGDIIRNPICLNEQYYAVKTKAIASWVPCKVIEEVEGYPTGFNSSKTYKIKFTKLAKYPMFKTVYAKHMAYFDPPNVRLPIGSRVIAYFDATSLSRGKEKMLIPSAFYPGIIAEPLKQSNKFRYLVFYDDGYFQYVNHKDVRLVCQASENVWEDVHHQSREFIHNYLTQYAVNRPMVQTQKGQSMLVDYNGKWIYARVIDVDCSLVQMLFEGQSRSEWIYRGSTRLGPVYKESNNLSQKNTLNATRRRTEPFIRYINGDDSSTSQQVQETEQQPQAKAGSGEIRSVAKKSVSRVDNSNNNNNSTTGSAAQPVPTVRHLNNSTIFVDDDNKPKGKVVYYTARKNLPPRNYVPHICNPSCPFNITHNLSFYSPLAKPLLSGWERQVFRQKSKKFIIYRGPCGKRMRNIEELHRYLRVTDNELNVDNFDFSPDTNCLAEYVLEKCLVNKKDISCGKEKMPIPCVNYYDETMPPACEYSAERIPTEGVPLNLDEEFLCGCDCEDDCSDKTKCACWQLTYAGAKYGMPTVPIDMVGYQYKRLYEHVPTGIYECNSRCKCKASCVNRVVQQPLQSKLQVFKTSNRGWGLRCINDVPRGSFICVYAGQMLTEQVANEGGLDAGDEYFAELDYIEVAEQIKEGYESDVLEPEEDEDLYNPERDDDDIDFRVPGESFKDKEFNTRLRARRGNKNSTDGEFDSQERQVISFEPNKNMDTSNEPNEKPTIRKLFGKDESCYVMDAKVRGNLGRYFNHSCSPNLFVQNVFVDTHDLRFPWVAFFASTHIRAGTELTWNYNYEVGVVPGKVLYCQCGAPNCRQRLL